MDATHDSPLQHYYNELTMLMKAYTESLLRDDIFEVRKKIQERIRSLEKTIVRLQMEEHATG
jgi:hypothetical protein